MVFDPRILTIELIVTLLVMVVVGNLVAAHKAIGIVNKNEIMEMSEDGNKKAQKLMGLFDKKSKILSATIILSFFGGFYINQILALNHGRDIINYFIGNDFKWASGLAILVASVLITLIYAIFTIFFPRQIARQHGKGVALSTAGFVSFLLTLLTPIMFLTETITNIILFITRQNRINYEEEFSEENVISMLEIGQKSGALKEEGKKMINSIFDFDDKLAYEIMTPRTDVFAIDILDDEEEYIEELMEMKHSRIPVFEGGSDNIIGILHIKDYLIEARNKGFDKIEIRDILREAYMAPETKNIDTLFFELQKTKQHLAVLIDEYGGFSGIATMEDIIEEVMGDIDDEYDEEEMEIEEIGYKKYLIDGFMNLDDINEELETDLESETSETVGGLIIDILGEIPDENQDAKIVVEYENYHFEVVSVKDRRIERVIMTIMDKKEVQED